MSEIEWDENGDAWVEKCGPSRARVTIANKDGALSIQIGHEDWGGVRPFRATPAQARAIIARLQRLVDEIDPPKTIVSVQTDVPSALFLGGDEHIGDQHGTVA